MNLDLCDLFPTLPPTWCLERMGRLGEVVRGASPRPKGDPRYFNGPIPWITITDVTSAPGKWLTTTREGVTAEGAKRSRMLSPGTLIISNSGTVCVPKFLGVEGCIHDGFVSLLNLSPAVRPSYLYYYFDRIRDSIRQRARQGITQVNLNTGIFSELRVPLPPVSEQDHIVSEIDKHFSRLDAAVAALKRAQANLKRYRADALAGAFRQVSASPRETVEAVAQAVVDCPHSTPAFQRSGIACVDTTCILPAQIDRGRLRFVEERTYRERIKRLTPTVGDVIFAREGTVGTAAVVPESLPLCLGQRVMLIRPSVRVTGAYLQWALMAPQTKAQYRHRLLGSTVPHLNVADVRRLTVPIPSVAVQEEVVRTVERQWSLALATDTDLNIALRRCNLLRAAVLRSAFSGRLVPQDPHDEPASVLLERIRVERATQSRGTTYDDSFGRPQRRRREGVDNPAPAIG